jgi:phosphoserine / homoserine phosphotransferase
MNHHPPPLLATDLEGILLPEIWIAVAEKTGIEQLRLTTRDVADYDQLMGMRLDILRSHRLTVHDIQAVIATMDMLPGAEIFLSWVRTLCPFIIITDSFYELVAPFLPKLKYTTLFAHQLVVDPSGTITGYRLRVKDGKRKALNAFRELGFRTLAVGDSYNDVGMLDAADQGILYRPPAKVSEEFPHFTVAQTYDDLKQGISAFVASDLTQIA